ncbi:NARF domain-containing protein [Clostridiisalibacter paucivorans]|uniref:NARF domain-containing protein n=1 Tax=Clostridiisalibacter paucivorans TaxID=408753 RepID=UPI00047AA176|nr:NARF domain-containing protein [Clostridiisalibacter paucivorans]
MHKSCPCYSLWGFIKKNFKFIILLLLVLVFSIYNIYSIKSMEREVKDTINEYDATMEDINTKIEEKDQELINEFYKLRLDWTNEKIALETKKGEVGRDIYRIYIYGGVFIMLGSLGIWTRLKQIIEKIVEDFTGEDIRTIQSIMNEHKKEVKIKKSSRILMLAEENEINQQTKLFLYNMGFKHITTKNINNKSSEEDYDLIFINNEDGNIAKQDKDLEREVGNIVKKYGKDTLYFYYNKNIRLDLHYDGIKKNFANSEFTLYERLIETLWAYDKLSFTVKTTAE